MNRRTLLAGGLGVVAGPWTIRSSYAQTPTAQTPKMLDPDQGVTAPEDLMKEHGVLNRCLLIYEEGLRRIESKASVNPEIFLHTAQMIQKFVEQYHEKNEENYIFPVF